MISGDGVLGFMLVECFGDDVVRLNHLVSILNDTFYLYNYLMLTLPPSLFTSSCILVIIIILEFSHT